MITEISLFSCHECEKKKEFNTEPKHAKHGLEASGWIIPETFKDKVYCGEKCYEKNKKLYEKK